MTRVLAVLALAAPLLVACANHSASPAGTVVDRGRRYVVVKEDITGNQVRHSTSRTVARRCSVGERWPNCT